MTSSEKGWAASSRAASIASRKFDGVSARRRSAPSARGPSRRVPSQARSSARARSSRRSAGSRTTRQVGKQREEATIEGGEHQLQPALDDVVALLDGIHVVAEGEQGGDVHGEALELVDDVDRLAAGRRPVPALPHALGNRLERRVEAPQVAGGEGLHGQTSLRPPGRTLGGEDARDAHLGEHRLDVREPTISLGPRPQDLLGQLGVGDHDRSSFAAHPVPEKRTVLPRPAFEDLVQTRDVELQEVAEERQLPSVREGRGASANEWTATPAERGGGRGRRRPHRSARRPGATRGTPGLPAAARRRR